MYEKLKELLDTSESFVNLVRDIYESYQDQLLQDPHCLPGLPMTLFTMFFHSIYVGHHALAELVNLLKNVEEAEKVVKEESVKASEETPQNETSEQLGE